MPSPSFVLELSYPAGGAADRLFLVLAELTSALQELDRALLQTIDTGLVPMLQLERLENEPNSPLRCHFHTHYTGYPTEPYRSTDWPAGLTTYLHQAKLRILNGLADPGPAPAEALPRLQAQVLKLAERSNLKQLPMYGTLRPQAILETATRLNRALMRLEPAEKLAYKTESGEADLQPGAEFNHAEIDRLLVRETLRSTNRLILKVKKPDYLSDSMWEFRHDQKLLKAKVLDFPWLAQFYHREVALMPGDAIRADVEVIVKYGHDLTVLDTQYYVTRVLEILEKHEPVQALLFAE